jgi:diguanylate cyclase (GGDEF)-like protein
MTIGLASSAIGDVLTNTLWANVTEPPYPSIADVFYLGYYPPVYVALVLLARGRIRKVEVSVWLDGAIVGLTLAAIAGALILQPIVAATSGSITTVAVTLAYPVGDLALLVFIAAIYTATGFRPGRSFAFIGTALLLGGVADSAYTYLASAGTYQGGTLLDSLWPAAALCTGFAAWQRTPGETRAARDSLPVFATSAVFTMLALGLVILDHYNRLPTIALWLASAAILVGVVRAGTTHLGKVRALRSSEAQALTDGLTDLGNRRRLMIDLERALDPPGAAPQRTLAFYDLDGFKDYNDLFGHSAGDALLVRLGRRLAAVVDGHGRAYRLGGDEFCVLFGRDVMSDEELLAATAGALRESGDGFTITCSGGLVATPREATTAEQTLQLADERMYDQKGVGRRSEGNQARDVLMQTLLEQEPELHEHLIGVAGRAVLVARRLGFSAEAVDQVRRGAELHDVGKIAIPAEILHKAGPLDDAEWAFMRQHTVIGERIIGAAPGLVAVARIVRLSHERYDGTGYPDGLYGDAIPLGASVIAVCDAYDAMVSDRAYRRGMSPAAALAEVRRCSGSQFDPAVVEAFVEVAETWGERRDVESIVAVGA